MGTMLIATSIYVVSYFEEYRAVAIGIKSIGFSLSGVVGASLLPYLERTYGVDGALMITGGMMLHLIPLALMIRNPRPCALCFFQARKATRNMEKEADAKNYGTAETGSRDSQPSSIRLPPCEHRVPSSKYKDKNENGKLDVEVDSGLHLECSDVAPPTPRPPTPEHHESRSGIVLQTLGLLQTPCFYILLVSLVSVDFTSQMFNATVVDYAGDKGVPLSKAAQLAACSSVGAICGQVSIPFVSDKLTRSRCTPAVVSFAAMSLCFFLMPCFVDFVGVSIVTVLTGIQQGYLRTLKPVLVADYLGARNIALCWGIVGLIALPLTLCEPSIVGAFRDTGGSYDNLYRTCGALDLLAASVLLVQACLDTRNRRRTNITAPNT
ncbi:monocarboxylate transporter 12-like [Haemaphysalis longicornis]